MGTVEGLFVGRLVNSVGCSDGVTVGKFVGPVGMLVGKFVGVDIVGKMDGLFEGGGVGL